MTRGLGIDAIQAVRLQAMLRIRQMTVDELSAASGLSDRTLNHINMKPLYRPQGGTWERLAETLRCSLTWLRTGEGLPFEDAAGRMALAMASKGYGPQELCDALQGRVSIDRLKPFLDGKGELSAPEITFCCIALGVESRWVLYGPDERTEAQAVDAGRLLDALRESMKEHGIPAKVAAQLAQSATFLYLNPKS